MNKMEKLFRIAEGFDNRFGFKSPFHAVTNIMEEAGETVLSPLDKAFWLSLLRQNLPG